MDEINAVIAYHIYVYGKVQGVGFRYWTKQVAQKYKIMGWVRNTMDYNCVEIIAESEKKKDLDEFVETIKKQHPYARVNKIKVSKIAPSNFRSFQIMR